MRAMHTMAESQVAWWSPEGGSPDPGVAPEKRGGGNSQKWLAMDTDTVHPPKKKRHTTEGIKP